MLDAPMVKSEATFDDSTLRRALEQTLTERAAACRPSVRRLTRLSDRQRSKGLRVLARVEASAKPDRAEAVGQGVVQ